MNISKVKYIRIISLFIFNMTFANECDERLYITLSAGGSFSQKGNIKVDNRVWDFAPEGYDSKLGKSELYGVALGYKFSPLVSIDLDVTTRPSFKYKKFQSPPSGTQVGFIGTKTRFFNLSNISILGNVYFYADGFCNNYNLGFEKCFRIRPYIGAGVGISYNEVKNFHSVLDDTLNSNGAILNIVSTVMPVFSKKTFSAQATVGFEFLSFNDIFAIDLGYRFFYGGKIETNNYVTSADINRPTQAVTSPPWKGKLLANEFFINLKFLLDF